MIPVIFKKAADSIASSLEEDAKKRVEAEKSIPTYKEMRQAKIHPGMGEKERWAYRTNKVQQGYIGGTIGGGVTGGILGAGAGALLGKTKFGKNMPGLTHALTKWVFPATIGYTGYRVGAIQGRKAGEAIARKQLGDSGNPIPYVDPISVTDRGASDPIFMGTMMGAKTLQAVISDKGREKVEGAIKGVKEPIGLRGMFKQDANNIANAFRNIKLPKIFRR